MAASIHDMVMEDYAKAYYAHKQGNIDEALRLYRLVLPHLDGTREIEKDGLRISRGSIIEAIREIEKERDTAAGYGKLRRINVTHAPYSAPSCDC